MHNQAWRLMTSAMPCTAEQPGKVPSGEGEAHLFRASRARHPCSAAACWRAARARTSGPWARCRPAT
eukprot:5599217-Pleurochrysis_carterae.AAC.1